MDGRVVDRWKKEESGGVVVVWVLIDKIDEIAPLLSWG